MFPKATAFHLTILDCVIGRVILISLPYYFYFIIMFACGFVSKPCLNICATFSLDSTLFWQKNVQVFWEGVGSQQTKVNVDCKLVRYCNISLRRDEWNSYCEWSCLDETGREENLKWRAEHIACIFGSLWYHFTDIF